MAAIGSWQNKRERQAKDAHATPAKGQIERHLADAPVRGAAQGHFDLRIQVPFRVQVGGFCVKRFLLLRNKSDCYRGRFRATIMA